MTSRCCQLCMHAHPAQNGEFKLFCIRLPVLSAAGGCRVFDACCTGIFLFCHLCLLLIESPTVGAETKTDVTEVTCISVCWVQKLYTEEVFLHKFDTLAKMKIIPPYSKPK